MQRIWLLLLVGLLLAACSADEPAAELADLLPLHEERPTFLFFYADP